MYSYCPTAQPVAQALLHGNSTKKLKQSSFGFFPFAMPITCFGLTQYSMTSSNVVCAFQYINPMTANTNICVSVVCHRPAFWLDAIPIKTQLNTTA